MSIDPSASPISTLSRARPFSRPVRIATRTPRLSSWPSRVAWCWRARISVGASNAACAPLSTAVSIAASATSVLPEPTSPWSRRSIGADLRHVAPDLADHAPLRVGELVRQLELARSARPCRGAAWCGAAAAIGAAAAARAGWRKSRRRRGALARVRAGLAMRWSQANARHAPQHSRAASDGSIHSRSSGARSSASRTSSPRRRLVSPSVSG